MGIKIVTSREDFEPIEEGVWDADLIHMEERKELNNYTQVMRDVIRCEFVIVEGEMKGRKALISVTPNISSKSKLFAICRGTMKREFTPEELAEIGNGGLPVLEKYLGGKPVRLVIKHKVSARGNTYYVLSDYMKSPRDKGQTAYIPHTESTKDTETAQADDQIVKDAEEIFGADATDPKGDSKDFDDIAKELDEKPVAKATPK
jgi:hypothetical protein